MPVRGLTIVVAGADPDRYLSALRLAAAHAALGGRTRVFLDEAAVAQVGGHADLVETALDLGVAIIVCQTGLAASALSMEALDPRIEAGGMTSLLATIGEDRLAVV